MYVCIQTFAADLVSGNGGSEAEDGRLAGVMIS